MWDELAASEAEQPLRDAMRCALQLLNKQNIEIKRLREANAEMLSELGGLVQLLDERQQIGEVNPKAVTDFGLCPIEEDRRNSARAAIAKAESSE